MDNWHIFLIVGYGSDAQKEAAFDFVLLRRGGSSARPSTGGQGGGVVGGKTSSNGHWAEDCY